MRSILDRSKYNDCYVWEKNRIFRPFRAAPQCEALESRGRHAACLPLAAHIPARCAEIQFFEGLSPLHISNVPFGAPEIEVL